MKLYVLNMAMSIVDEQALSASANAATLSAEERSNLRLDSTSAETTQRARDLEAVVVGALKVAGCGVRWVRVDYVQSPPEPTGGDELDVAFLAEEGPG